MTTAISLYLLIESDHTIKISSSTNSFESPTES